MAGPIISWDEEVALLGSPARLGLVARSLLLDGEAGIGKTALL